MRRMNAHTLLCCVVIIIFGCGWRLTRPRQWLIGIQLKEAQSGGFDGCGDRKNLVVLETELKDRAAIQEGIHRYCQAVDRCDIAMLKSCYWPGGYDDHDFLAGNAHEFAEYVIACLG